MQSTMPPPLPTFDAAEFRRRLAGVADPNAEIAPELQDHAKKHAIRFVGVMAQLFGGDLDATTKWDRIATGIQSAYAKTASSDWSFFISQALDHIKASATHCACSGRLQTVMDYLDAANPEEQQAWMAYLATHLHTALVFARRDWQRYLADHKAGADMSWWGEEITFEEGGAA